MRPLRFLLIKEFKQIFRNRSLLPMIFAMPLIQLLVMPLAADYEVKNINISIIDNDQSSFSRELISKISASNYFDIIEYQHDYRSAQTSIESDKADLILDIPRNLERNVYRYGSEKVFVAVNAINGSKATVGSSYLNSIINEFAQGSLKVEMDKVRSKQSIRQIQLSTINWYNPFLNYRVFMVPGILVTLVTMVGAYMCGLNIVKEKEIGTIEQINVSPIKKHHYILGKLIPFWVIGIFVFSIGFFIVAWGVYGIKPQGNILLLYSYLAIFLMSVLGLGLLISTYSNTQQQAMSVSFFFMMIFILMSGLFTSIDSMPNWAKFIAYFNPVTYFIDVMRMVVLKGSGLVDITKHLIVTLGFATLFNTWAVINYQKTN